MIENSRKIHLQNNALSQHNATRNPKPDHIHHPSPRNTTFLTKQPSYVTPTTYSSSCNPNQIAGAFELPSGWNILETTTSVSWDGDSDDIDIIEDGEGRSLTRAASLDILLWYEKLLTPRQSPSLLLVVLSRKVSSVARVQRHS